MKIQYKILCVLAACIASFFLGRSTIETKEIVREVKGKTVYGRVPYDFLTVKHEFKTDINFLPYIFWKGDTVRIEDIEYIHTIPDTAKIIEDFLIKREYAFNVFDNENGKLDVNSTIQYNRMQSFDYSFTPIHKEITRYREKMFVPFVSGSYNSFGIAGVGGGLFYKNLGIEYNYLYQIPANQRGHEVGLKVKF